MPCPSLSRPSGFAGVLPTLEDYAKNRASFILGGAGCFFPPCVAVAEAVSVAQHLWEDAMRLLFRAPLLWLAFCFYFSILRI